MKRERKSKEPGTRSVSIQPMPESEHQYAANPGSAPSKSFQQLLDKLAKEHCREVDELRAEIKDLRSAASDSVRDTGSKAPAYEKSVRGTVRDTTSGGIRFDNADIEDPLDNPVMLERDEMSEQNNVGTSRVHNASRISFVDERKSGVSVESFAVDSFDSADVESTAVGSIGGNAVGAALSEVMGEARPNNDTAQVHRVWCIEDPLMKNWSSRFDTIVRIKSMMPRLSDNRTSVQQPEEVKPSHPLHYFLCCYFLPFGPSAKFKVCWDLSAMCALCYDISFIPMQAFAMPDGDRSFIGILDWSCIVFWTLDLPLNFLVGYYTRDGTVVMDLCRIAKNYAKGWLFLDLTIIGSDWLTVSMRVAGQGDATGGGAGLARLGKLMRVARSLRTLRLLRLMKLRELMSYLYDIIESEWMSLMLGTLLNLLTLVYVNHGIACLWFWLGSSESQHPTWVNHYGYANAPWSDQYVASLHWSLTQFTAASSPVLATNSDERTFSVIVILFAIVAFSSFLSGITSAMTRLRTINAHHLTQTILLNKFLKQNRISRDLTARVTRYVQLVQVQHEAYLDPSKVEYLALMSGPLNVELQWERYVRVLRPHPFFHKCTELGQSAMHHVCFTAVATIFLARQDVVFDWGAGCEKMYFPQNGWLFYRRPPGFKHTPRYVYLGKGQWFCENALWTFWMHHGLMKALIEVTLTTLDVNEFHATASAHPEVFTLGRRYALTFVEMMNTSDPNRPYTWDVPWEVMYADLRRLDQSLQERYGIDNKGNIKAVNVEVLEAFEREAELVDLEYSRHEEENTRRYASNPMRNSSES